VLAKHPTLSQLVLTSRPILPDDSSAGERRWRYIQLAEQILAFLVKHGSKIHLLSFIPRFPVQPVEAADEDGSIWPIYHYKKGTILVRDGGNGGEEVVRTTAVPRVKRGGVWCVVGKP
jgi:hypothetical protein